MKSRDVSVVIPAYNAESFIIEALDSVANQTQLPYEVIVVNDGSTDDTAQVVREWLENKTPGFTTIFLEQDNKGLPATRNIAIKAAKSKWIALLDADDVWEPDHLEVLFESLNLAPDAIAAYGAGRLLTDGNIGNIFYDDFWDNPSKKYGHRINETSYYILTKDIFPRLIKGNFIKPSSLQFLRKTAIDIGLFNEHLRTTEDREFMVRLSRKGNFIYSYHPITQYRWHENNITQEKNAKRNMETGIYSLKLIKENKSLNLTNSELIEWNKVFKDAVKEYLYICSKQGLSNFFQGLAFIKDNFSLYEALSELNFKHIFHAFLS